MFPILVRKAESDVITQFKVFQQDFQVRIACIAIDKIGAFPSQNMLGAFGNDGFKTHVVHHLPYLIRIDQFGIPEGSWFFTE